MNPEDLKNLLSALGLFFQIIFSTTECISAFIIGSIALFGPVWIEKRKRKVFRPIPKIQYKKTSPYYSIQKYHDDRDPESIQRIHKIHLQMGLLNSGSTKIENCEVVLLSYEFFDGKLHMWMEETEHKNRNLVWCDVIDSYNKFIVDIHPGRERFIDFGEYYLINPRHSKPGSPYYLINTSSQNSSLYFENGFHRINLAFYGDNIKPYEKTILLSLNGYYEPFEKDDIDLFIKLVVI